MKVFTLGWISVFIYIFLVNLYIWNHYWGIRFKKWSLFKRSFYLIIHLVLASVTIYYFYLFFNGLTSGKYIMLLSKVSGFYIAFLHYALIFFIAYDLMYLTRKIIPYSRKFKRIVKKIFFAGFLIFFITSVISMISILNSEHIALKEYNIRLNNKGQDINNLNLVYISDAHIGTSINIKNIDNLINRIEDLNPDILFLGGDFFDEGTRNEDKPVIAEKIGKIRTKYGIFAIEGNHEYKSDDCDIDKEMNYFKKNSINILQDEIVDLDKFYIIGRKDKVANPKKLKDYKLNIKDKPLIVLDHRPNFKEALDIDADLQISGHTHSGQFFPMQILNRLSANWSYQYIYGYHKIGKLNHIVSSGVGNWGIPIRMGSVREIVNIKIEFD